MLTDIEIAQRAKLKPVLDVAKSVGLTEEDIEYYGKYKAKVSLSVKDRAGREGKLILVTAITPTPAGEGKTTTTIGLADGLRRIGKRSRGGVFLPKRLKPRNSLLRTFSNPVKRPFRIVLLRTFDRVQKRRILFLQTENTVALFRAKRVRSL